MSSGIRDRAEGLATELGGKLEKALRWVTRVDTTVPLDRSAAGDEGLGNRGMKVPR